MSFGKFFKDKLRIFITWNQNGTKVSNRGNKMAGKYIRQNLLVL